MEVGVAVIDEVGHIPWPLHLLLNHCISLLSQRIVHAAI